MCVCFVHVHLPCEILGVREALGIGHVGAEKERIIHVWFVGLAWDLEIRGGRRRGVEGYIGEGKSLLRKITRIR